MGGYDFLVGSIPSSSYMTFKLSEFLMDLNRPTHPYIYSSRLLGIFDGSNGAFKVYKPFNDRRVVF